MVTFTLTNRKHLFSGLIPGDTYRFVTGSTDTTAVAKPSGRLMAVTDGERIVVAAP